MRFDKIDSGLLLVWRDRAIPERLLRHQGRWAVTVEDEDGGVRASARVWIHCDEDASLDDLAEKWRLLPTPNHGPVRSALVPLELVESLSEHPAVRRLAIAARRHARLDKASAAVGLPSFRRKTGVTGDGVLVGIIDSGIEGRHPDFAGRILAVWDQLAEPGSVDADHPTALLLGDDALHADDDDGHGTHVAGIAVGADATFRGVAPGAELIVVKCDGDDPNIVAGIKFVFDYAKRAGRPAVVNISLGAHTDSHDGDDDLSREIDRLSGPGRIVCCAAGNEGSISIHARVPPSGRAEKLRRVHLTVPAIPAVLSGERRSILVRGWYAPGDRVSVALDGAVQGAGYVSPPLPGHPFDHVAKVPGVDVAITVPPAGLSTKLVEFTILLSAVDPVSDTALERDWTFLLKCQNGDPIDMWVIDTVGLDETKDHAEFTGQWANDSMRIGSPGAARRAVTVANFTTKTTWVTAGLKPQRSRSFAVGKIAPCSSDGPLRNGVSKPDISAPGSMIVSSRLLGGSLDPYHDISRTHCIMGGTSMASPFVAGVVALLLQSRPRLTPEEVKNILAAGAKRPAEAALNKWGAGLLRLDSEKPAARASRKSSARASAGQDRKPARAKPRAGQARVSSKPRGKRASSS